MIVCKVFKLDLTENDDPNNSQKNRFYFVNLQDNVFFQLHLSICLFKLKFSENVDS